MTEPVTPKPGATPVVLVVEDDDDLRDAVTTMMDLAGYKAEPYARAADALARMRSGPRPCLVLLDLMMPGMTGWEFRAAQLAEPALADVPVVVFTASTTLTAPGAPPLGAVEVLQKPFVASALFALLDKHACR